MDKRVFVIMTIVIALTISVAVSRTLADDFSDNKCVEQSVCDDSRMDNNIYWQETSY